MNLNKVKMIAVVLGLLAAAPTSWAGGCRFEEVSPAKMFASVHISESVRELVLDIERKMNARGEEMNAVLIARSGSDMTGFKIIKDQPEKPLGDLLHTYAHYSIMNKEGRLAKVKDDGEHEQIEASNVPMLPDSYYSKEKLVYSHFGILLKRNPEREAEDAAEGIERKDWKYVVHLLAECSRKKKKDGSDKKGGRYGASQIFFETFDKFFWDTKALETHKKKFRNSRNTLIVVPKPEVQANLLRLSIEETDKINKFHQPRYNVASVPFRYLNYRKRNTNENRAKKGKKPKHRVPEIFQLKDQNSNQWPLEMLAAAIRPYGQIQDRTQAQQVLLDTNYRPSLLRPASLKNQMACDLRKGPFGIWDASNLLNCKEQAFRRQGIYQLMTVKSIVDYMTRNDLLSNNVYNMGEPGVYVYKAELPHMQIAKDAGDFIVDIACKNDRKSHLCKEYGSKKQKEKPKRSSRKSKKKSKKNKKS